MKILYFSLVHPHLSYGILAWGNANSAVLNNTIKLQKRAIRIINNAGYNSHTDPLFKISGILKVKYLYQYQTTQFMFDYNNNRRLPYYQYHSIRPSNLIIKYKISVQRDNTNLLYLTRCNSNFARNLPLYVLPQIWNKWYVMIISIAGKKPNEKLFSKFVSSQCSKMYVCSLQRLWH